MPRVKMMDQFGALKEETVRIVFKDLIVPTDGKTPNCDSRDRELIAGSLEFLRMVQVCKIEGTNLTNITDSSGRATFSQVKITRAPQGNYGVKY